MGITDFGFLFHKAECPQAPKLPSSFPCKRVEKRPAGVAGRFGVDAYCASLMAACAAVNALRAIFRIIPKCRSGVPGNFSYRRLYKDKFLSDNRQK